MKKAKSGFLMLNILLFAGGINAQSLEDGKNFLYYQKYISAKNVFQKLVNANPNDVEAVFWLGQTLIAPTDDKDIAGAKALYLKTLSANSNSGLLTAGVGHIELLENKIQDARSHFETAISLSGGKNIAVLNAVGFANADFDSKAGDAGYAIEKLKQAIAVKGFKDPEVYINLGDAYRKLADGGNAQLSYEAALALKPNYARAKYRIGRIYQTQGSGQEEIFIRYYNEAIAMDPNYTPVYYTLFDYFYYTNIGRAAEYMNKYLEAKGTDEPNACYYRAAVTYAQGLYAEAIKKCDDCIAAGGSTPYPKLFGVKAYAAFKLDDFANSKLAFDLYFQKANPNIIQSLDYETYAKVLLKFPGNESLAGTYIDKAVELDSTEAGKVALLKSIASSYESQKLFKDAADWYRKILGVKKTPSKVDLYNTGYNYNKGGEFRQSINIFNIYIQKFPDESFGYYMNAKNQVKLDSLDGSGYALGNYLKIVNMTDLIKDKPGEKDRIKNTLRYLIEFYANVKRNKDSAILFTEKGILLDPADSDFVTMKQQISSMNFKPLPPQVKGNTTINAKGEKVTVGADGTITTIAKDGITTILTKDGKITIIGKDGKVITTPSTVKQTPQKPGTAPKKK